MTKCILSRAQVRVGDPVLSLRWSWVRHANAAPAGQACFRRRPKAFNAIDVMAAAPIDEAPPALNDAMMFGIADGSQAVVRVPAVGGDPSSPPHVAADLSAESCVCGHWE
jgi:hypothetical protein